ncbi:tol-pal system protein YbgF [Magnetospirillum sp. J10]|uniref:Cell division coordinator CpoB n=2 Tax=Magnetospirillum sulfuroxidans TaxID=611300 RepID=A0ABS5I7L3_9PROT|nr:tol-pal system protein YbgF [Magnetospirillum sulfuroxidans]MBR9970400.1 tol-pal system protein YbgF [Magnetospirillum sulfuroxidans]
MTVLAQPAFAQYENRAMADRLDRLERDLQMMQAQAARSGSGGSTVITSPALGGGAINRPSGVTSPNPLPAGMAVRLDERVDQLEELVRQLTGRVEEANFKANQVAKQMERLQADLELRFKELQAPQPQASGAAPAQLSMPATAAKGADTPIPAGTQSLGTLSDKDLKKPGNAPVAPPKDAQGQYDMAYDALQSGDYATAEKGFQDFLSQYGNHQLAGNAQYWLGDIAYVRKDFNTSAVTFLEGYKKFPKHSKAADMIYKAGSAFGQMGKKKEACTAFGILFSEQPKMPDRVKRAATAEKQKYDCK